MWAGRLTNRRSAPRRVIDIGQGPLLRIGGSLGASAKQFLERMAPQLGFVDAPGDDTVPPSLPKRRVSGERKEIFTKNIVGTSCVEGI